MAAQILSNAHISLILNGKTISGFADEERPVEFPATDDLIDVKYGNDGSMYGMTKPMYGGEITIRLAPSSEATAWFVKERIKLKMRKLTVIPFRYTTEGSLTTRKRGKRN